MPITEKLPDCRTSLFGSNHSENKVIQRISLERIRFTIYRIANISDFGKTPTGAILTISGRSQPE
jgi:hypothetical protein